MPLVISPYAMQTYATAVGPECRMKAAAYMLFVKAEITLCSKMLCTFCMCPLIVSWWMTMTTTCGMRGAAPVYLPQALS